MKFGLCAGSESSAIAARTGFDYIELPLAPSLTPESDDDQNIRNLRDKLRENNIAGEAFNILLPGDLPCVGPDADHPRLSRYFASAFSRVAALGGQIVVFGSGGQRRIPPAWPAEDARSQFLDTLQLAADHAAQNGITIAIEPLNTTETNLVTSVAEAVALVQEINHPALQVLSDLYHIQMENQPFSETTAAGKLLAHIHVAGANRRAPKPKDLPALTDYFRAIQATSYDRRISIECRWTDLDQEAEAALDVLKTAWGAAASAQ